MTLATVDRLKHNTCTKVMVSALGFIIVLVALGIFMPDVLRALNFFLLTLLSRATAVLQQTLPVPTSATRY